MKALLVFLLALASCTLTGNIILEPPSEGIVCFCPEADCMSVFAGLFLNSTSADCALYSIDQSLVDEAMRRNISLRIVTDKKSGLKYSFVRKANSSGLMHNKFCVLDNRTVITGSFNPVRASRSDSNNIVIINSPQIALNYKEEFRELWNKEPDFFTEYPIVQAGDIVVENYFCPDDFCAAEVEGEIESANRSVYFMAYSFTHPSISSALIVKASDVDVRGVIEGRNAADSVYGTLKKNEVDVRKDSSKNLMHHKVFIIDSSTVITGSFNPTRAGDERNDENILIIRSAQAAALFENEFWRLYNSSKD